MSPVILNSQEHKWDSQTIESLIEELAQNNNEELDYSEITEILNYYLENPLNLNTATEEELEKIPILNTFQIKSLLAYRQSKGDLLTLYELQLIEGFSMQLIQNILPFVQVHKTDEKDTWSASKSLMYGRHEIISRVNASVQKPMGFNKDDPGNYPGNRLQVLTKYRYNYNQKLLWGFTAEKDPGEQFFKGVQKKGFDYYSGYLQIKDIGPLKNTVIGNYQIQLGQGLIMWSAVGNTKSSLTLNTRKRAGGIKCYTSANENAGLQGAASTFKLGNFTLIGFGSYKAIDANLKTDSLTHSTYFSSFVLTGMHATENQLKNHNTVNETTYGTNINWQKKQFNIGTSFIQYHYNYSYEPTQNQVNTFTFRGSKNQNASLNFEYRFNNLHFFGETALSKNMGKALVTGINMHLHSQLNASVLYRNYEKNYQAQFANAFREGSKTQNEEGIYLGAEMLPFVGWKIAAYYDIYKFHWLKTSTSSPSYGNDFLLQTEYQANGNLHMYWRLKYEQKQHNSEYSSEGLKTLATTTKILVRYHLDYAVNEFIRLKSRIEFSEWESANNKEQGYLLYQDFIYRFQKVPLKLNLRYTIFDTESFESRIYTYEADVYQAFSVPAFYQKGTRTYLMLQTKPLNNFTFWLKLSQTYYANKTSVGSGLNEIEGNKRTDFRIQVRYKF